MTSLASGRLRASVVIPTYQRASTLAEAVNAALVDPAAAEVIVVVDGHPRSVYELLVRAPRRSPACGRCGRRTPALPRPVRPAWRLPSRTSW